MSVPLTFIAPFTTSDHRDQFGRMNDIFRDPFGGIGGMGMLEDGRGRDRRQRGDRGNDRGSDNQLSPFGDFGFGNIFGNMSRMMQDMNKTFVSCMHTYLLFI